MFRRISVILLLALLVVNPISALADDNARWIAVNYQERQQVVIPCSSGLLCTVSFARGEVLGDYFNSDPVRWKMEPTYSQNSARGLATAQLVVQTMIPGLRANMVIFARNSRRVYRLLFISVTDRRPLYASFVYPTPRHPSGTSAKPNPRPMPSATPGLLQIVDAACASERDSYTADAAVDRHGRVDAQLAAIRPIRICHDFGHVYVVMPASDTAEVDLPVPYEITSSGLSQVNYHYSTETRTFVIDSIADIVLRTTNGRRVIDMHLRRMQINE